MTIDGFRRRSLAVGNEKKGRYPVTHQIATNVHGAPASEVQASTVAGADPVLRPSNDATDTRDASRNGMPGEWFQRTPGNRNVACG